MEFKIGEHWLVNLWGMEVHMDTLVTLWITMAIIILFALIAVGRLNLVPNKLQAVFENIVKIFSSFTKDLGEEGKRHTPILIALFLLIITSNLIGQIPWKIINFFVPRLEEAHAEFASPTNDINVTAALAIIVLIYYIVSGIRAKGIGYFKHYFQPVWFMTPLNMLEDVVRPLSLAFRLFANILAGEILIMVLGGLLIFLITPESIGNFCDHYLGFLPSTVIQYIHVFLCSLLPLPIMFLELLVAFIQALVFTLLTSSYINSAVAKH